METTKSMLTSKTIRGAIISIIATILKANDIDIGDEALYVNDIVATAGLLFSVYGRIVATEKIL